MNDLRCPKCGALLLSADCLQELCNKIFDGNISVAKFIIKCEKCRTKYGVVMAIDSTAAIVLVLPPEKIKECLAELTQLLNAGITIATIALIMDNTKASQYISFL
jgi:phage FluMu protein Com